ncbi:hypothetical protein B0J12DRAFT_778715 [Macrophomina phaseolina]|uniref:Uncharacterized protein n=1 Tax=Macrophomina phaseolina TaxID=35725 RepID=A0ABQ8FT34_9PEZI|nr:hypothetical protein B0J12DRAFT_778715 [Macrophomina phaseolina]
MAQNSKHVTSTVWGRAGTITNANTTPDKIHAVGSLVKAIEILTKGGNFSGVESIAHDIDQLRVAIQQKDQELEAHCITAFRVESGRLERLVADEKAKHESSKEVIKKLQQQIEQFQNAEASRTLKEVQRENEELKQDFEEVEEELSELQDFALTLDTNNLESITSVLRNLWHPINQVAYTFFAQNVPESKIQNDVSWIGLERFAAKVPLPRSNSNAAASMHVCVVMAMLARLIDQYIFQPTYILGIGSIATSRKESFMRAMLLASPEDEQTAVASKQLAQVTNEIMGDVRNLLPEGKHASFYTELHRAVERITETWKKVQRLEQKVEPIFELDMPRQLEPVPIVFQGAPEISEHPHDYQMEGPTDRVKLVIFPGMFAINEGAAQQVIPETVLMTSQTEEAEKELQETQSWLSLGRNAVGRAHQTRSRRRSSVQQDGLPRTVAGGAIQHFLSGST